MLQCSIIFMSRGQKWCQIANNGLTLPHGKLVVSLIEKRRGLVHIIFSQQCIKKWFWLPTCGLFFLSLYILYCLLDHVTGAYPSCRLFKMDIWKYRGHRNKYRWNYYMPNKRRVVQDIWLLRCEWGYRRVVGNYPKDLENERGRFTLVLRRVEN